MKKPKNPTRRQMDFIRYNSNLNPENWMVERDTSSEMVLINQAGSKRTIKK